MPFIASQSPPTYYGTPGYAVPMPMAKMSSVERSVLARERQQYDPHINYGNFSFDYAREMPQLDMYVGMSGEPRPLHDWRNVRGAPLPTFPRTIPPTYDNEVDYLNMSVGVDPDIYDTGVAGLGVPPHRLTIPAKPQSVSLPLPAPVQSSTKVAVIGGAALFVGASIAVFLYIKSKKGGK